MNTDHQTLLTTTDLCFGYDDQPVLHGINLHLQPGEMVGLIGPNGAGKSTLLRLLLGLNTPNHGQVTLAGKPVTQIPRQALAKLITLVPQDAQIAYAFTVEDIVAMGRNPWLSRFQPPTAADQAIIHRAMQQTDVMQFAQRPVNALSGGERQRVLIARAIAQQTPIILLDEATANLDICHQFEVLELAQTLAQEGRLVIAAIHDLAMASRFCDRLLLLADQTLQANARPDAVITEANLARFFHLRAEVRPMTPHHQHPGVEITALGSMKPHSNLHSPLHSNPITTSTTI